MFPTSTAGTARRDPHRRRRRAPELTVLVCGADGSGSLPAVLAAAGINAVVAPSGPASAGAAAAVVVWEGDPDHPVEEYLRLRESERRQPPVIVLCDPSREAAGIALVERGAADYVLRDHLARLPLAIRAAHRVATLENRATDALRALADSREAERRAEVDFTRSLEELHRLEADRSRLTRLLVQAHEDERRAIAADLHDDPLQALAAAVLRLHTLRRWVTDPAPVRTLDSIADLVGGTIARLRGLMFNLRPPALDRGDLLGPMRERLEQVREEEGLDYSLTAGEPPALASDTRVVLYRVAQEAIVNVVKHAGATRIDVSLEGQGEGCLLRIADDGAGFEQRLPDSRSRQMGLQSMRERAESAGGWLRIEPGTEGGTVVSVWVPACASEPAGGAAA